MIKVICQLCPVFLFTQCDWIALMEIQDTKDDKGEYDSSGPEGEMTKEDVSEPPQGEAVLGCFTRLSSHQRTVIHQVASAPMPSDCEFSFFNPSEPQCREILQDSNTTIPELFAVLRQWVPQVQKNIDLIGSEILKRGCGVNDRDGLTDMSLLHYCCKAGAPGIGPSLTHLFHLYLSNYYKIMLTTLVSISHYSSYMFIPLDLPTNIDATCSDFDFGTALHIAASNLCISAVKCLLELGANPAFKNEKGQCPVDVVPDPLDMPVEMADAAAVAKELRVLLRRALPRPSSPLPFILQPQSIPALSDKAKIQLASMGIRLGDRVAIAGQKVGTLRFCGSTEFSGGLWAGVELDKAEGKNNGAVAGVQYFTCRMKHGIFAPLSKISKPLEKRKTVKTSTTIRPSCRIDSSRTSSKINAGKKKKHTLISIILSILSRSSSSSSLDSRRGPEARPRPLPRRRISTRQRKDGVSQNPRTTSAMALRSSSRTTSSTTAGFRSRTPSGSSSLCDGSELRLGERVLVVGQRTGVIQFCGKTSFAPGIWLGIELDKPNGKNDGSVGGVRYFSCPPKHGVFAPPSHVQRIHGSVDCLSELSSSRFSHPFRGTIRRSFSTSTAIAALKESNRKSPVNRNNSNPLRRRSNPLSGGSGGLSRGSSPLLSSDGQVRLRVGMQVFLNSANDMASIRYFGTADFAPGLWLGLELRSPKGKNDGSVGGRRYFTCRPGYGVLVRPSRVTYRGINGSRLVNDGS
ncbi:CAP-Gly domain-containing linker protein 4 [Oryzias melastigma]|uniref:CAP-Gly domain-containing linker protein 4 n=1 Tax=Oryzias melastigma TaxID=30732 RepID=A0A834CB54_ORYME|nr:CAP-Gly domain-containing linker protein 4 [Oryzias melastigma]